MKLNCTIDGTQHSMIVNADKPLNLILRELVESFPITSRCLHASCGNCMVLINGSAALSCLIPAFRVNGAAILTYAGFRKTRFCHDIERAYAELGIRPCSECYAAKTLLIGSLLNRYDQTRATMHMYMSEENRQTTSIFDHDYIEKEMGINTCPCTRSMQIEKVIELAYTYRRRRSGR